MGDLKISLAAARVNANLTQDDVASKLHVTKQTVVNWEKGRCVPSFAVLHTLSDMYNFPIDNIFLPTNTT